MRPRALLVISCVAWVPSVSAQAATIHQVTISSCAAGDSIVSAAGKKHRPTFELVQDRFTGSSVLQSNPVATPTAHYDETRNLSAASVWPANVHYPDSTIGMVVQALGQNWSFLEARDAYFLLDDSARIVVSAAQSQYDHHVVTEDDHVSALEHFALGGGTLVKETVVLPLSLAELRQMAAAKRLEFRLGPLELDLQVRWQAALPFIVAMAECGPAPKAP